MRFMVTMLFHADDPAAMAALIPEERAHVQELMEQGTIHRLYLATDGSRGWMVMQGESEEEINGLLASFPLRPFMQVEIVLLR